MRHEAHLPLFFTAPFALAGLVAGLASTYGLFMAGLAGGLVGVVWLKILLAWAIRSADVTNRARQSVEEGATLEKERGDERS